MPGRVYVLHFEGPGSLSRAFEQLMGSSRVDGCLLESELGRLRFLAPQKFADRLVERIYLEGELVWCARHDLKPDAAEIWPADVPA